MEKYSFYFAGFLLVLVTATLILTTAVQVKAADCDANDPSFGLNCTASNTGLKPTKPLTPQQEINRLIGTIIKTILGFTGVIFMIMIVAAGDLWMTAGGNEEKITKARTMILNAAIGILIVFGAFIATDFITDQVIQAISG